MHEDQEKLARMRQRMVMAGAPAPRSAIQAEKTIDDLCHVAEGEWAAKLSNAELADELIANLWADIPARERKKAAVLEAAIDRLRDLPNDMGMDRPPIALPTEMRCTVCGERLHRLDDMSGLTWIHSVGKFCQVHRLRHTAPNTEGSDRGGSLA